MLGKVQIGWLCLCNSFLDDLILLIEEWHEVEMYNLNGSFSNVCEIPLRPLNPSVSE